MLRLTALMLLLAAAVCAQTAPAPDAQQLAAQFGPAFKAESGFQVITADLDGDGQEDAIVVATTDNPLLDEAEFHYKVLDPMNSYFGFGDPKVTAQFAAQEQHPHLLLIVHNWRAPKQKFVIINIQFEKLSVGRVLVKKKPVTAVRAQDVTGAKSAIYFDGKKWKWQEEGIE